jgi:hypothetical protein
MQSRFDDPIPDLKRQVAAELARLIEGWNLDDAGAWIGADRWRVAELRRRTSDRADRDGPIT